MAGQTQAVLLLKSSSRPSSSTTFSKRIMNRLSGAAGIGCSSEALALSSTPGDGSWSVFTRRGLHIWDIDHVIITDGRESASFDLERLWTFNREINSLLKEWQLSPHVISYGLTRRPSSGAPLPCVLCSAKSDLQSTASRRFMTSALLRRSR